MKFYYEIIQQEVQTSSKRHFIFLQNSIHRLWVQGAPQNKGGISTEKKVSRNVIESDLNLKWSVSNIQEGSIMIMNANNLKEMYFSKPWFI